MTFPGEGAFGFTRGLLLGKEVKKDAFGIRDMRIIIAAVVLIASVVLVGCFHHRQSTAIEPIPETYPPYK